MNWQGLYAIAGTGLHPLRLERHPWWAAAVTVLLLDGVVAAVPTKPEQLEEVVVTARRREESLQNVPLAVSVLDNAAITRRDLRSAVDLTATLPNLQTPTNPVLFSAPTFFIRGVGQGDHNWNTENGVAVFVDDVYLQSTAAAWVDLLDIERIEILRGPQGTLYGRNSTSGAIKFIPRKPDPDAMKVYGEALIGAHARLDIKGGLNLPLANGRGAAKLELFRTADHGYFTRVDPANRPVDDRLSRREHVGARMSTLWRPMPSLELEFNADIVRQDNGMNIATPIVPANPDARDDLAQLLSKRGTTHFVPLYGVNRGALEPLTVGGSSGQTGGGAVFKATFDSSIGRLRSITAWGSYDEHFISQLGGRSTPSTIFGVTLYGNVNTEFEKVDQLTEELQLTGSLGPRLDYTAGAYYFHNRWRESEYGATNGVPANFSPFVIPGQSQSFGGSYNDIKQTSTSWALFASLDWRISDQLMLSLGGRQTWDRKQLYYRTLFEDHVTDYPGFPLRTGNNWNRFTPRLSVDWRAVDNVLLYVSLAKGYKVGNVEGARSSIASTASHWLAPEIAHTWEVGLKADWLGHRLRTNLAAFSSENTGRTDLISPDLVASSDIRSKGIEVEIAFFPVRSLQLFANVGWLWADYRNLSANHPVLAPDPTGYAPGYAAHPPMTPKYTGSAGGQYTFTLRSGQTLVAETSVRAVGRHYHALGINNFDSERVEAYAVLDGSLSWRSVDGRTQLTLGAHNLFDKTYYQNGLFGSIPEFAGRYYVDGRAPYLRLKYSF